MHVLKNVINHTECVILLRLSNSQFWQGKFPRHLEVPPRWTFCWSTPGSQLKVNHLWGSHEDSGKVPLQQTQDWIQPEVRHRWWTTDAPSILNKWVRCYESLLLSALRLSVVGPRAGHWCILRLNEYRDEMSLSGHILWLNLQFFHCGIGGHHIWLGSERLWCEAFEGAS